MNPSENAYQLIKSFEGLRCKAYKALSTERYYTIGYGHCSPEVKKGQYITIKEAERLLVDDVMQFAPRLNTFTWMEQQHYDAVCSLIYNIGWYNFRNNYIWHVFNNCYQTTTLLDCARRMTLYVRSGGKIILGLQRRRCMEANYFLGYDRFIVRDGQITEIM